jgi:hypothetical protein
MSMQITSLRRVFSTYILAWTLRFVGKKTGWVCGATQPHRSLHRPQFQEGKMEGLITKSSKLVALAGAVLALSLIGCSSGPDPAERAVNAANRADQAASRAEDASQKAQAAAQSAQAAATRVEQAANDAKAAADRAEAIAAKTMASGGAHHTVHHHHHAAAAEGAAPAESAPAAASSPATP